eukprot:768536-Hanusia_phi.AAC.1
MSLPQSPSAAAMRRSDHGTERWPSPPARMSCSPFITTQSLPPSSPRLLPTSFFPLTSLPSSAAFSQFLPSPILSLPRVPFSPPSSP